HVAPLRGAQAGRSGHGAARGPGHLVRAQHHRAPGRGRVGDRRRRHPQERRKAMKRSHLVACVALIALCEAATLFAYPRLPEMVATHWNAHGVVDGYSSRWTLFVLMPAM